jgi:hypothetical protein
MLNAKFLMTIRVKMLVIARHEAIPGISKRQKKLLNY